MDGKEKTLDELARMLFQAHPWHGVPPGDNVPDRVNAFIEIVPTDEVKYELDKTSGHLKLDRPQRFSSVCPTLYGFIPQTFCGNLVGELCSIRTGIKGIAGDGDPMDICVLTEKTITHGNLILKATAIGGLRMLDGMEADDKIVAVLESDLVYGEMKDIRDCPPGLIDRLKHYFLSYKQLPGESHRHVEIVDTYGRDEAAELIRRGIADYNEKFGAPDKRGEQLRRLLS